MGQRYQYSFSLTAKDEIKMQEARTHFKTIEIVKMGIEEARKQLPKVPQELIKKVKKIS